ncbi:hypothetical protein BCR44DRAFT_138468 [Catenaria anguillulae PL171]|uniref:Ubiquitin thioesterase OTU n=1 Tax=Catenaria anguillulae PL171 TaxID=765915 RepID=A0A1Y2I7W6_9FUNG|nr:hypothetical protein BCR44DRAFT_138468 [Catenaria anguillulae PL171]
MRFRIRSRTGQSVVNDPTITPTATTVFDLKVAIFLHLHQLLPESARKPLPEDEILTKATGVSIKFGYPPQTLPSDLDPVTLDVAGVRDGEQLTVEVGDALPAPPSAPKPAAVKSATKPKDAAFNPSTDVVVGEFVHVPDSGAYLILRQSPDDNSCLFHSIAYVLTRGKSTPNELRQLAIKTIRDNPLIYTDAVLGRSRDEYCQWLSKPQSWGGAIELAIFAKHFQTEICSVDVLTLRIDRFGEGQYDKRAFVVYNSIHYDALGLSPSLEAPRDFDATVFPVEDGKILEYAVELAGRLKAAGRFTDTANFTLSCANCGVGLRGQDAALEHARTTGHQSFTEYKG